MSRALLPSRNIFSHPASREEMIWMDATSPRQLASGPGNFTYEEGV